MCVCLCLYNLQFVFNALQVVIDQSTHCLVRANYVYVPFAIIVDSIHQASGNTLSKVIGVDGKGVK